MKHITAITSLSLLGCLICCAATSKIIVAQPVGPDPVSAVDCQNEGTLQVYSARKNADMDINMEEQLWNNDFGRNDFLYTSAHTSYSILNTDGMLVEQVKNAKDQNDNKPARVALSAGTYKIEAAAETADGKSITVDVPVVIKAGQTTVVHLDRNWRPAQSKVDSSALVKAYDGRLIGWLAATEPQPMQRTSR